HPDFLPLAILDSVLAGASSFNPFGGGISNKTSRLYRALVEGGLAAAVSGSLAATIDPYLYTLTATIPPDRGPDEALVRVDQEIDRLLQSPLAADELAKAIKQARALFAYSSESITNQAFWLGYSEMFADYAWFEGYLSRIETVTPEAVLAAARTYLIPSRRVVGMYRPTGPGGRG
ncbi:MAG: M16 family metallopeptidase, partial [Anaerolineales bacterium]